jgi:hypothetical protein
MDPEALASMYSAGTDSVPAFNAYLQGLAYNASSLSTGDAYTFLSAKEAFEQAIELDPEFALAHWELAGFWEVQMRTNNIVAGLVDLPKDEMRQRFDDAIERAIEFEDDPANVLRYRELQAEVQGRFLQALRLNTDFLAQRPNSHEAQDAQLRLLATLSMDDELFAAIREFQERDGYDILVTNNSLTYLLMSNDKEYMREFAHEALRRVGDSAFIQYQAHRTLLWADDIDGASKLVPFLASSDLPEESRNLVTLRQACAENKVADAKRIYDGLQPHISDDPSTAWISSSIMGYEDKALDVLMELESDNDFDALSDFLTYAFFDPSELPNFMKFLKSQGIEPRMARKIPNRCKS